MSIRSDLFEKLSKLVLDESGIVVAASKEYLVESRLGPIAKQRQLASIDALIEQLLLPTARKLIDEVVDAMTTNETSFLRDRHPFDALCKDILPEIIEARSKTRTLRIWSAACSTGQEIYTIAMLLREQFPQLADWRVELLATDLSPTVLDRAKQGTYSQVEVNRGLPAKLMIKYFQQNGTQWTIIPELRNAVDFRQMNLLRPFGTIPTMDVVFLRNVLIYFEPATKTKVLERIHDNMAADGFLLLGAAETTTNLTDKFTRTVLDKVAGYRPSQQNQPCKQP